MPRWVVTIERLGSVQIGTVFMRTPDGDFDRRRVYERTSTHFMAELYRRLSTRGGAKFVDVNILHEAMSH